MEEKKCKHCAMQIPAEAKICPHCRKKQGGRFGIVKGIIGLIGLLFLMSFCSQFNSYKERAEEIKAENQSSTNDKPNELTVSKETSKSKKNKKHQGGSPTDSDYSKVVTYATILGRAVACGADISVPSKQVGSWMDSTFPRSEVSSQVQMFATTITYAAEQQKSGNSPDSCSEVLSSYNKWQWP